LINLYCINERRDIVKDSLVSLLRRSFGSAEAARLKAV
jgi:hypothetical protein